MLHLPALSPLLAALVATVTLPGPEDTPQPGPAPDEGGIEVVDLVEEEKAPAMGPQGAEDLEVRTASLETNTFNVAAVTWDATEDVHATAWVRVRTGGEWSEWIEVHDDHHGPDPDSPEAAGAKAGTEPFVTGDADAIEVRVVPLEGTSLPEELQLELIDPGTEPLDAAAATATPDRPVDEALPDHPDVTGAAAPAQGWTATPAVHHERSAGARASVVSDAGTVPAPAQEAGSTGPSVLPAAVTYVPKKPKINSRAAWGANEKLRQNYGKPIQYGTIKGAFVHHTAGTNSYSKADVPAIIRGIYRYHVESRDFYDIGYNFLVDRFGRIWEGAYGGIDKAVVGAHTQWYNSSSFSLSAIGNYQDKNPESAVIKAYQDLFAWKLALHGVRNPLGTANYTYPGSKPQPVIAAHRDTKATACPGQRLYDKLSTIRSAVNSKIKNAGVFPDVPLGHKYSDEIEWLADEGITTGYTSDGTFRPTRNVTRGELAAFLYRYAHGGKEPAKCTRKPFPDVPASSRFCGHITWLADAGVITGYGGSGDFGPDNDIRRDHIAIMLARYRAMTAPVDKTCDRTLFPDIMDSDSCWAVTWLANTGITTGYDSGVFRPKTHTSRQHMAAFLYRYDQKFG